MLAINYVPLPWCPVPKTATTTHNSDVQLAVQRANLHMCSQNSRREVYLKPASRRSNAVPACQSVRTWQCGKSTLSRRLCRPTSVCYVSLPHCTCWRRQIRCNSQVAICQGTRSGLTSHLVHQNNLRHPTRPLPPPVPAHGHRAAQRAESSRAKSNGLPWGNQGGWAQQLLRVQSYCNDSDSTAPGRCSASV